MATIFPDTQPIPEGSCRQYSAQLVDLDGQNLNAAQISSIRFTLVDARSGAVINDRYKQEVKNVNGGTLSATALFTMHLGQPDTVTVGTSKLQQRRALFDVTFDGHTEHHEVFFYIQNLKDIPYRPQEDLRISDVVTAALA